MTGDDCRMMGDVVTSVVDGCRTIGAPTMSGTKDDDVCHITDGEAAVGVDTVVGLGTVAGKAAEEPERNRKGEVEPCTGHGILEGAGRCCQWLGLPLRQGVATETAVGSPALTAALVTSASEVSERRRSLATFCHGWESCNASALSMFLVTGLAKTDDLERSGTGVPIGTGLGLSRVKSPFSLAPLTSPLRIHAAVGGDRLRGGPCSQGSGGGRPEALPMLAGGLVVAVSLTRACCNGSLNEVSNWQLLSSSSDSSELSLTDSSEVSGIGVLHLLLFSLRRGAASFRKGGASTALLKGPSLGRGGAATATPSLWT